MEREANKDFQDDLHGEGWTLEMAQADYIIFRVHAMDEGANLPEHHRRQRWGEVGIASRAMVGTTYDPEDV